MSNKSLSLFPPPLYYSVLVATSVVAKGVATIISAISFSPAVGTLMCDLGATCRSISLYRG